MIVSCLCAVAVAMAWLAPTDADTFALVGELPAPYVPPPPKRCFAYVERRHPRTGQWVYVGSADALLTAADAADTAAADARAARTNPSSSSSSAAATTVTLDRDDDDDDGDGDDAKRTACPTCAGEGRHWWGLGDGVDGPAPASSTDPFRAADLRDGAAATAAIAGAAAAAPTASAISVADAAGSSGFQLPDATDGGGLWFDASAAAESFGLDAASRTAPRPTKHVSRQELVTRLHEAARAAPFRRVQGNGDDADSDMQQAVRLATAANADAARVTPAANPDSGPVVVPSTTAIADIVAAPTASAAAIGAADATTMSASDAAAKAARLARRRDGLLRARERVQERLLGLCGRTDAGSTEQRRTLELDRADIDADLARLQQAETTLDAAADRTTAAAANSAVVSTESAPASGLNATDTSAAASVFVGFEGFGAGSGAGAGVEFAFAPAALAPSTSALDAAVVDTAKPAANPNTASASASAGPIAAPAAVSAAPSGAFFDGVDALSAGAGGTTFMFAGPDADAEVAANPQAGDSAKTLARRADAVARAATAAAELAATLPPPLTAADGFAGFSALAASAAGSGGLDLSALSFAAPNARTRDADARALTESLAKHATQLRQQRDALVATGAGSADADADAAREAAAAAGASVTNVTNVRRPLFPSEIDACVSDAAARVCLAVNAILLCPPLTPPTPTATAADALANDARDTTASSAAVAVAVTRGSAVSSALDPTLQPTPDDDDGSDAVWWRGVCAPAAAAHAVADVAGRVATAPQLSSAAAVAAAERERRAEQRERRRFFRLLQLPETKLTKVCAALRAALRVDAPRAGGAATVIAAAADGSSEQSDASGLFLDLVVLIVQYALPACGACAGHGTVRPHQHQSGARPLSYWTQQAVAAREQRRVDSAARAHQLACAGLGRAVLALAALDADTNANANAAAAAADASASASASVTTTPPPRTWTAPAVACATDDTVAQFLADTQPWRQHGLPTELSRRWRAGQAPPPPPPPLPPCDLHARVLQLRPGAASYASELADLPDAWRPDPHNSSGTPDPTRLPALPRVTVGVAVPDAATRCGAAARARITDRLALLQQAVVTRATTTPGTTGAASAAASGAAASSSSSADTDADADADTAALSAAAARALWRVWSAYSRNVATARSVLWHNALQLYAYERALTERHERGGRVWPSLPPTLIRMPSRLGPDALAHEHDDAVAHALAAAVTPDPPDVFGTATGDVDDSALPVTDATLADLLPSTHSLLSRLHAYAERQPQQSVVSSSSSCVTRSRPGVAAAATTTTTTISSARRVVAAATCLACPDIHAPRHACTLTRLHRWLRDEHARVQLQHDRTWAARRAKMEATATAARAFNAAAHDFAVTAARAAGGALNVGVAAEFDPDTSAMDRAAADAIKHANEPADAELSAALALVTRVLALARDAAACTAAADASATGTAARAVDGHDVSDAVRVLYWQRDSIGADGDAAAAAATAVAAQARPQPSLWADPNFGHFWANPIGDGFSFS